MNIRIRTVHAGEIPLSPLLPDTLGEMQIPDSICYGATGSFGHVLLQRLEGEDTTLFYHTLYFVRDELVTFSSEESVIRLQIILRNSYFYDSEEFGKGVLHERGLTLHAVPFVHTVIKLRRKENYSHLSIHYRKEHFQTFLNSFPLLGGFLAKAAAGQAVRFNEHYCMADAPILSLVDNMLDCDYTGHLRKVYLDSLSMEILLLSLLKITATRPGASILIGEEETVAIYQAKEWIMEEMGKTFTISALIKRSGLSLYKLNNGFKAIYGMGVTEFLLEARMTKAHRALLEADTPINVVAENSGYSHHHAFELAFKKYFGYSPAFVLRSGKKTL